MTTGDLSLMPEAKLGEGSMLGMSGCPKVLHNSKPALLSQGNSLQDRSLESSHTAEGSRVQDASIFCEWT